MMTVSSEIITTECNSSDRGRIEEIDDVMIIGCGALGSSILRVVKQFHPHSITVTDIDDAKLQEAFDFVTSHDPSCRKGVLTFDK